MNKYITAKVKTNVRPEDRVPLKEKLCYGAGGLMDGGGVALMSCVMLGFMNKYGGIAMGVASTIMMIAKLWDAFTDPFMGFISDNTRGKYGRRKPYMFFGGIALIVAIFLLFMPLPDWGVSGTKYIPYIIIMYLLWNTCSTLTQVPYTSMASDISPSFKERNNCNTVKLVFTAIASGLAYVVPLVLLEALISEDGYLFFPKINGTQFWLILAIVFGALFGGGLILCGLFTKERIKTTAPKQKFNFKRFVNNYVEPYKNRSYRWHIVMYASAFMCMDMISALAVYYATDVWRGYKLFGMDMSSMFIVAPLMVAAVLAFPLARVMMDKKSKAFAFRMGLPFYIGGGLLLAILDPSWGTPPILVPIVAFIMGLGFGGAQMMPWIIFPDTLDVAEMATGARPTGTYSGMMTLARKIAGAFGVGLVGWIIGGAGYDANLPAQSSGTLLAIRLVLGLSIAVFISVSLFASFRYKVTSKKLERMRFFIDARKNGNALTPEEEEERTYMVAELYGKVNPNDIIDPTLYDENGNLKVKDDNSEIETVISEGVDAVAQALAEEANDLNNEENISAETENSELSDGGVGDDIIEHTQSINTVEDGEE
ncbi:MAG: MFS transporter [Bacteroides sp.]|nr:MFS transporter [Bacillota bacterium]MCM1394150.1 MFS transporter [[Eubacterium] siraeum]MCM1455632.1 MFS transporter [Bacteroides sp.]